MRHLRLLLVDDQRLFADSLRKVLEMDKDLIRTVAVAYSGPEAVRMAHAVRPDIVLMDTYLGEMNGIDAAREIKKTHPNSKVVMLSAFGYEDDVKKALAVGAVGYILKDISPDDLLSAIKTVCSGGVVLPQQTVSTVLRTTSNFANDRRSPVWLRNLSKNERRILLLITKGYSNSEIADQVCLGLQTVRNYVSDIYSKLQAKNRFEAMRMGIEAGIEKWAKEE